MYIQSSATFRIKLMESIRYLFPYSFLNFTSTHVTITSCCSWKVVACGLHPMGCCESFQGLYEYIAFMFVELLPMVGLTSGTVDIQGDLFRTKLSEIHMEGNRYWSRCFKWKLSSADYDVTMTLCWPMQSFKRGILPVTSMVFVLLHLVHFFLILLPSSYL